MPVPVPRRSPSGRQASFGTQVASQQGVADGAILSHKLRLVRFGAACFVRGGEESPPAGRLPAGRAFRDPLRLQLVAPDDLLFMLSNGNDPKLIVPLFNKN